MQRNRDRNRNRNHDTSILHSAQLEPLESRQMLAVLSISQTDNADTLVIDGSDNSSTGVITANGIESHFEWDDYTQILINTREGDDDVQINYTRRPIVLGLWGGNDHVTLGNGDLDSNIKAPVELQGGSGFNEVVFDDRLDVGLDAHGLSTPDNSRVRYHKSSFGAAVEVSAYQFFTYRLRLGDTGSSVGVNVARDAGYIAVLGGDGNDALRSYMLSGTDLFFEGSDGNDSLTLGVPNEANIGLGMGDNFIQYHGGAGTNALFLNDADNGGFASRTYTFDRFLNAPTTNSFTIEDWAGELAFSNAGYVDLHLADGRPTKTFVNWFRPSSTDPASVADLSIYGDLASYRELHLGGGNLAGNVHANVFFDPTVNGKVFFDGTDAANESCTFDTGKLTVVDSGVGPFVHSWPETDNNMQVTFNGSPQTDHIWVRTNAREELVLNTNGGDDRVVFGDGDLAKVRSIDINGGNGNDELIINHSTAGSTLNDARFLADVMPANLPFIRVSKASGNPWATAFYTSFSSVTVQGSGDNERFETRDIPVLTKLTIKAGGGQDIIDINGGGTLDPTNKPRVSVQGGPGLDLLRVNRDGGTSARVSIPFSEDLAVLELNEGSDLQLENGDDVNSRVIDTQAFVMAPDARINLNEGRMIFRNGGPSRLSQVQSRIAQGRDGGTWDGLGITSSTATANGLALGYALAGDVNMDVFHDTPVEPSDVIVRMTFEGDANLDGKVDLADFVHLRNGFGGTSSLWSSGNFNYDDDVDLSDFVMLRNNFGKAF